MPKVEKDAAFSSLLILVVEDDEDIRDLVVQILEVHGFQVATAIDGGGALIEIVERQPDLILLDAMLSDFSGIEVLNRIRSSPEIHVRQIPVLMLSALLEKPDFEMYAKFGVTEFMSKPFQSTVLVERIIAILATSNFGV